MIVLIGASASGKTEISKILFKDKNFTKIITYTTRNVRIHEKNGVDYFFVSKDEFLKLKSENYFLETTEYNNNFYGTPLNQLAMDKVLIVDPNGFKAVQKLNDKHNVSFLIDATEENRRLRMIQRGDEPQIIEQRILNDRKDFAKENIGNTDFVIDSNNSTLEEMAEEIYKLYIKATK